MSKLYTGKVNTTNDFDHDGFSHQSLVWSGVCSTAPTAYAVYVKEGVLDIESGYEYNNMREGGHSSYSDCNRILKQIEKEFPGFIEKLNNKLLTPISL